MKVAFYGDHKMFRGIFDYFTRKDLLIDIAI